MLRGVDKGQLQIVAKPPGIETPIPTKRLQFADMQDFGAFMESQYNAELVYDDVTGDVLDWQLDQLVVGTPIYYDGDHWRLAEDPVGLMVGGLDGYVDVGGVPLCVNRSLCGGPMMLGAMAMAAPAASSSNNLLVGPCTGALDGDLCVESWVDHWYDGGGIDRFRQQELKHRSRDMRAQLIPSYAPDCKPTSLHVEWYVPENYLDQLTFNFDSPNFLNEVPYLDADPASNDLAVSAISKRYGFDVLGSTCTKGWLYTCTDMSCPPNETRFCINNYNQPTSVCPPNY